MLWAIQHCPGAQINLWSDSQATLRDVLWESAAPGVLGKLLSAVACAVRVHSTPSWHYVKAHDDHPWNEMADSLAKWAAKGNLYSLPIQLIPTLRAGREAAWEWIRVVDQVAMGPYPACDGSRFPDAVVASKACGFEPSAQLPLCVPRSLSLVSFNVQTLAGTRDPAALKVDRRVMLAQQLKDKDVFFCWPSGNDRFFGGVALWGLPRHCGPGSRWYRWL